MKNKGWLILLLCSVLGYSAALWLFPGTMSAAKWRQKIDRNQAIAIAKDTARNFGIEAQNWEADVSAEYSRRRDFFRTNGFSTDSTLAGQELFSPVTLDVKLFDPQTGSKTDVALNSDGKLLEFSNRPPRKDQNKEGENKIEQQTVADADIKLVENLARNLWGDKLLASMQNADFTVTKQGSRLNWKSENANIKLQVSALVREGKIHELSIGQEFTPAFESKFGSRRSKLNRILANTASVTIWPVALLVIIFYFVGLALKRIQHRLGFSFLVITFLLLSIFFSFDGSSVQMNSTFDSGGNPLLFKFLSWLAFLVGMMFLAGSLYFIWTAGHSLAIRLPERKTISLELILRGKLMTKPVARSLAAGLLAGGIVSSIPFLITASRIFPGMELDSGDLEDYFSSAYPALSTLLGGTQYLVFLLYGFLAQLIGLYVKRPMLSKAMVFACSALGLFGATLVYLPTSAFLTAALLVSLALTSLYFRADFLSVIVAVACLQVTLGAGTLLAQPSASLQASGWRAIVGLAVMAAVAFVGMWKFREVSEEETAIPAHLLETRVERERLKAEFNVAQRAQQQMLPDAPPQIPGLEISAVCLPSKEVGGDLYDFLSLPDGKLGIVVADVSGKGVPASLYMTLTKGLLDSVSENTSDPGEILREVNRHLYEVCRRKMFVTLFLGVIDPATQNLTFARAGHNPTVFRRPAEQLTSFLKPKGMGLGLNNGSIFDQSLQVESLQLQPNDKLYFYSDGITEAMNHKNDEYGEERLANMAEWLDGAGAMETRDAVMADVRHFLGSNQPQDDQTLVVVRVV